MTKPKTFNQASEQIAVELAHLVCSKQLDYGPDNILKCPVGPEVGIIVRLHDKLSRLTNLYKSGRTPNNESITDTWNDIMGYGMVGRMVSEGSFTLPVVPDEEEE